MDSSADNATAPGDALPGDLIGTLEQGRRQFLALVDHVRPELHRYCTRMTGSVADGEDVVQETLARACFELSQMKALPPLRPWLFRIAHNRAIDHWRHETLRASEPLDEASDIAAEAALEPDNVMARRQAVRAALSSFLMLAPAQRGCVILKDVLEHSIEEIGAELNLSVPAVKAALHRGRATLRQSLDGTRPQTSRAAGISPELKRYARLFNAHDWEGVRAMLADDVRLDLVSQRRAAGRREVGSYLGNYERAADWHVIPGWLESREVLAMVAHAGDDRPRYFIELDWSDAHVTAIRDFRYVTYIAREASFEFEPEGVETAPSSTHRERP